LTENFEREVILVKYEGSGYLPLGEATFSPEDNKLRWYPGERIPRDLYDLLIGATYLEGFGLTRPGVNGFFGRVWNPELEDLMVRLAGDIVEEGTTPEERAEAKAERLGGYSGNAAKRSKQAFDGVERITSFIPMGQPILVGHHSEKRARKDRERINNGMRKGIEEGKRATYWAGRAKSVTYHAARMQEAGVIKRRIKKMEAECRRLVRANSPEARRVFFADQYKMNYEVEPSRPYNKAERNEIWQRADAYNQRWIDHLEGQVAFWKACLPEEETDWKGMLCKGCYVYTARYGYWAAVQRVNKNREKMLTSVSLLLHDKMPSWHPRKVDPDHITALQPPGTDMQPYLDEAWCRRYARNNDVSVEEAGVVLAEKKRAAGELAARKGVLTLTKRTKRKEVTPEVKDVLRTLSLKSPGDDRCLRVLPQIDDRKLYLQVAKVLKMMGGEWEKKRQCFVFAEDPTEALAAALADDVVIQDVTDTAVRGWFPTTPHWADVMVQRLGLPGRPALLPIFLEPSAGEGALIEAVLRARPDAKFHICEIDDARHATLYHKWINDRGRVRSIGRDFLQLPPLNGRGRPHRYKYIIMNPPWSFLKGIGWQDYAHIKQAYNMLSPGGTLVAMLCLAHTWREHAQSQNLQDMVEEFGDGHWWAVDKGALGANARGAIIRLRKE
jgi:hypothetical protein